MSPPAATVVHVALGAAFVAELGDTDCEDLGDGGLVQPINAITSFAYVAVGVVVVVAALGTRRNRSASLLFGALLVAVGLGSVAFHGPQPDGARFLHDVPILLTALFMVAHNVGLLWPARPRWLPWVAAIVLTAGAAVSPDAGVAATGVLLVAVAVTETLVYRRRVRPLNDRTQRLAYVAIIAIVAAGGASWLLGKTDSPVCDPDGVFQFHGLWHVLSALAFGAWWWLALGARPAQPGYTKATAATSTQS